MERVRTFSTVACPVLAPLSCVPVCDLLPIARHQGTDVHCREPGPAQADQASRVAERPAGGAEQLAEHPQRDAHLAAEAATGEPAGPRQRVAGGGVVVSGRSGE